MRRLLSMFPLAFMTAAASLAPAASASASAMPGRTPASQHSAGPGSGLGTQRFGVRLYDVPVDEAHNPRGLRYIIDFLPSGTVVHRRILILNQETRTAHFTVYPDSARIAHGLFTGDAGKARSELTSWITVQHPSVTLRAHASALDMITIRVPKDATRGEHYGVIWAQQTARAHGSSGVNINEVARVGIRIYLAVGPGGAPPTKFSITSLTGGRAASGQPLIIAHVVNTGGRAVDLSGQARLSQGPGHSAAGPFPEREIITLAPGQSANMTFAPGNGLPDGPWHAVVTLVSGFNTATARATIQFPGTATAWRSHLPIIIVGACILALLILALILSRRARRTRAVQQAPSVHV